MANSIAKLEKAFRRDPDSPHFARLADRYLKRGRTERALELCQKGCASFPDYATGFIVLSKCYEKRGDLEEAREAMGQALRLDPENPSGYKRLAHLFEQLGVTPLVLQSLRQAAYLDPFDASLAKRINHFAGQTHQDAPTPEPEPEELVASAASQTLDAKAAQPQALPPPQPSEDEDRDALYGDTDDSELFRLLQEIEDEKRGRTSARTCRTTHAGRQRTERTKKQAHRHYDAGRNLHHSGLDPEGDRNLSRAPRTGADQHHHPQ